MKKLILTFLILSTAIYFFQKSTLNKYSSASYEIQAFSFIKQVASIQSVWISESGNYSKSLSFLCEKGYCSQRLEFALKSQKD